MYQLAPKILKQVQQDKELQLKLSVLMGNGYMAVHMDLQAPKNGKNIAKNYDALTYLETYYQLPISKIRKKI